jgi:transcription elongation factor GreA-like protein
LSDSDSIKLYLDSNIIEFDTKNTTEAIEIMKKMLSSDQYNDTNKKVIVDILNNLLKYQEYYYLKKYLKYKKLYNKYKTNYILFESIINQ